MKQRRSRGPTPPPGREAPRGHERHHDGSRAPYTFALKLRIAQAIVDNGSSQSSVARTFGLSATTVGEWVKAYREGGTDALRPPPRIRIRKPSPTHEAQRAANSQIASQTDVRFGLPQQNTLLTGNARQFFVVYPGSSPTAASHVIIGINNGGKTMLYDPQIGARFSNPGAFGPFIAFPVAF